MKTRAFLPIAFVIFGWMALSSQVGTAAPRLQGTATPTPTQVVISAPSTSMMTATPASFPTNTPRFSPTPTLVPGDHFWFSRPFAYDSNGRIKDFPARGYAFGSTANGRFQTHHGIDIENPRGTFVRAVANGTVTYAGNDYELLVGPVYDFYGNVIIIEHDFRSADGRPVFSLYGHLSEIDVETGDSVLREDIIGAVGATGVALGSHLHLEVRIGSPFDYHSTYNPELWTVPWRDHGVFAAKIVDEDGIALMGQRVELSGQGRYFTGWTYKDTNVNSDPYWGENIVIGDMPAGEYDIKVGEIRMVRYKGTVYINPNQTSFYNIIAP